MQPIFLRPMVLACEVQAQGLRPPKHRLVICNGPQVVTPQTSRPNDEHKGPSIKYVTLFLANFDPLSHFVTHLGTPKSTSHISDPPPIFSRPSTKIPDKSPLYK